jgi:hypothetical protein
VDPLPYLRSYAKVVRPIPANEIYSHLLSILEKITGGLMSRLTSKESHFSLGASNRGGISNRTALMCRRVPANALMRVSLSWLEAATAAIAANPKPTSGFHHVRASNMAHVTLRSADMLLGSLRLTSELPREGRCLA